MYPPPGPPSQQPVQPKLVLLPLLKSRAPFRLKIFSLIHIGIGVLCIGLGIVLTFITTPAYSALSKVYYGLWSGPLFIVAGIFGTLAATTNNRGWITASLYWNIASAITSIALTCVTSLAIYMTVRVQCFEQEACPERPRELYIFVNSVLLVLATMGLGISIGCIFQCCKAVCGCCKVPFQTTSHHTPIAPPSPTDNRLNHARPSKLSPLTPVALPSPMIPMPGSIRGSMLGPMPGSVRGSMLNPLVPIVVQEEYPVMYFEQLIY